MDAEYVSGISRRGAVMMPTNRAKPCHIMYRILIFGPLLSSLAFSGVAIAGTHGTHQGEAVYAQTCIACHVSDGGGAMPGIPDLSEGSGPMSKPDEVLLKSILEGIESGTAPMPMPAKGGDGTLTEAKARMVLKYIRREFKN